MTTINDRHNPSFALMPINNNRTAWRPFGLPVVLVVPHKRSYDGSPITNNNVFSIKIYVEDVPKVAKVAGHDNVGKRSPDRELYSKLLTKSQLLDKQIDVEDYEIRDRNNNIINIADADNDSTFYFVSSTGVMDTVPYYPDAAYYDLSDVLIEVELLPADTYNLVYEAGYFNRVISKNGVKEFLCIDINQESITRLKLEINHPGDVINEFYNLTPPPYLTNSSKSKDTTIGLYRPFTDVLQDVFDEQNLLKSLNWVFKTPAEAIPYLSSLLGWDLPYFPKSLDALRKAVLLRTVEFQNLSGSRRSIINIFRLFGFEILISNLWWSSDGKRLIRPNEKLPSPYETEEITIENVCQVDTIFSNYAKKGFTKSTIPFLYRPQIDAGFEDFGAVRDGGNITIEAYLVTKNSDADKALQEITNNLIDDPGEYGNLEGCTVDTNGFLNSNLISDAMSGLDTDGFNQILLTGKLAQVSSQITTGTSPLSVNTITFNREENSLSITTNGYFNSKTQSIYVFAIYNRQKIIVPDIIKDLQSNRFDIQVLTQDLNEFADPVTLDFSIEFLNRLKAFHSILNSIRTRIELTETYAVTDWCVGGDTQMRYDIDAGRLQVPPAIIPDVPGDVNDCSLLDPKSLGYKDSDLLLRLRQLSNLPEEHEAWKILDTRQDDGDQNLSIGPMQKADRDQCLYNYKGQDRVTGAEINSKTIEYNPAPNSSQQIVGVEENPKPSPNDVILNGEYDKTGPLVSSNSNSGAYGSFTKESTNTRNSLCETDNTTDYCYKGRPEDEILHRPTIVFSETQRNRPCSIGMGVGVYYTYPAYSKMVVPGVQKPCRTSKTSKSEFSGKAESGNFTQLKIGIQSDYLNVDYNKPLPEKNNSYLGELYRAYGIPTEQTLHYTNRIGSPDFDQRCNLALQRPEISIDKPTMHLPGCRFPTLNRLESDFTHPTIEARPWDDEYSTYCGPKNVCGESDPAFLNCVMIEDINGDEKLQFDYKLFSIVGNNLTPDIVTLGDHAFGSSSELTEDSIIHSVYMDGANDSEYVVLDQVCDLDTSTSDGKIIITNPLFSSYNECNTGEYVDFADGYPCVRGQVNYLGEDFSVWKDVTDAMGMPVSDELTGSSTILFLLGSGILIEDSLRLDCGCLLVDCDGTSEGDTICSTDLFVNSDGHFDWECDREQLDLILKLNEQFGTCTNKLDGKIPSLLETL